MTTDKPMPKRLTKTRTSRLLQRLGSDYRANFLWPHDKESIEEAGYEFANAATEAYRKTWWTILLHRINRPNDQAQTQTT
jgi:hypothetical protein